MFRVPVFWVTYLGFFVQGFFECRVSRLGILGLLV